MRTRVSRAALGVALAAACAAPERAPAPPPQAEATVVAAPELAKVRCLVVAPFEDASDRPRLGEVATSALVSSIDPEATRVFPVEDLRRLFRGTSFEIPSHGASPRLAIGVAEKVKADAVLYGSVEGSAQKGSGGLVVSLRLQATAGREVLFANAAPVPVQPGEQVEVALRRVLLLAARPMLLKLGSPGERTCFDPELVRRARVMRAVPGAAAAAPAPEPEPAEPHPEKAAAAVSAPPPAPAPAPPEAQATAAALAAATTAAAPMKADPRPDRHAELVRRLEKGERFVLDDVEFAGRTTVLVQEDGIGDLARAMGSVPKAHVRVEVFVDPTGHAQDDASASMAQAMAVVRRLVSLGVARERIAQVAKGGKDPVASTFTAKGRAANRRVEVVALKGR